MRAASDVEDFGGGSGRVLRKGKRSGTRRCRRSRGSGRSRRRGIPRRARAWAFPRSARREPGQRAPLPFSRNLLFFDLHVPEPGLGPRRRNPERDERVVRPRRLGRRAQGGEERRLVAHGLVGRQHGENGVGRALRRRQRREGDRGRGVPAHGLEDEARARDFRQLGEKERLVRGAARDEDVACLRRVAAPRRQASRSSDSPPVSARKGFGLPSVERGHSRVPLPPARMRARIPAVPDIPVIVRASRLARQGSTRDRRSGIDGRHEDRLAAFDPHHHGALHGVARPFLERHLAGDAFELADLRQGLADRLAVQARSARQRLREELEGVVRQGGDVVGRRVRTCSCTA